MVENNNLKIWFYTVIVILAIIVLIFHFSNNFNLICFEEERILVKQYIGTTTSKNGGDCSNGCLIMDTVIVENSMYYGIEDYYNNWLTKDKIQRLYFSGENIIREDLEVGMPIYVNWCNTEYGERVRGVTQ